MSISTLQELFVEQLKDVHSAEKQLTKALPKMAKAASSPKLKNAFTEHLAVTQEHLVRLETIFAELGEKPGGKKCAAMEGLVKEGAELIEQKPVPQVLDAGLIAAAQRVEHYEMAAYGSMRAFARTLGHTGAAKLLEMTFKEEEATDKTLSTLAESGINQQAASPPEETPRPKRRAAK